MSLREVLKISISLESSSTIWGILIMKSAQMKQIFKKGSPLYREENAVSKASK
jgi:hypothetical protein